MQRNGIFDQEQGWTSVPISKRKAILELKNNRTTILAKF